MRSKGMKWDDISKSLGRSAISCRLYYQNYLQRRPGGESQGQTRPTLMPTISVGQSEDCEQRRVKCFVCGDAFRILNHLRRHLRMHSLMYNNFTCRQCHSRFNSLQDLGAHVASSHPASERYACMICGEECGTVLELTSHLLLARCLGQQHNCDQERLVQYNNGVVLNSVEGPADATQRESTPGSSNRSQRHPPEAVEVLQKWLDSHSIKQYPSAEEKQSLAAESGLTVAQVSTWFSNARSRHRSPLDDWIASAPEGKTAMESSIANEWDNLVSNCGYLPCTSSQSADIMIPATSLPLPTSSNSDYGASELPLTPRSRAGSACSAFSQCGDAIKSGPPRRGRRKYSTPAPITPLGTQSQSPVTSTWLPASPAAQIFKPLSPKPTAFTNWTSPFPPAVANPFAPAPPSHLGVHSIELRPIGLPPPRLEFNTLINSYQLAQPSSFQYEKRESSQYRSISPQDNQQLGPIYLPSAPDQQEENNNERSNVLNSVQQSLQQHLVDPQGCVPQMAQTFQCTFCLKHLSSKSWKRHEETMHLPRFQWICQPQGVPTNSGSSQSDPSSSAQLSHCVFCGTWQPEAAHFETCHRAKECADKPRSERAFVRKDHLIQHWKNFHGRRLDPKTAEIWKIPINYSGHKWSCGFCGEKLASWEERAIHIPKHFREGLTMDSWDSEKGNLDGEDALFRQFINDMA